MPPKRRRRFQGLYYHSSPPKVISMNAQITNGRKRRETDDFSVKLSTIRIWMHEKDIGKLTRLLWAGQGHRLSQQASTNSKVKRFLAAVPYVMNSIKDVHQAVIDNSLETLQSKVEPPVPPSLLTCKDANGLNIVHKAAGLGHAMILEYLIGVWPDGINETDITGKTPLHWAASAKNNMRCYTLLTQTGADEEALDYKMRTPSYYRHKPHEIERAFLIYLPEAPRISPGVSTDWEALEEENGDGKKLDIKIPDADGNENDLTAENENSQDDLSDDLCDGKSNGNNNEEELEMKSPVENGNEESENVPDEPDDKEEIENGTELETNGTEDEDAADENISGEGGSRRESISGTENGGSDGERGGGDSNRGGGRGSISDEITNEEDNENNVNGEIEIDNTHDDLNTNDKDDDKEETNILDINAVSEEESAKNDDTVSNGADENDNKEKENDENKNEHTENEENNVQSENEEENNLDLNTATDNSIDDKDHNLSEDLQDENDKEEEDHVKNNELNDDDIDEHNNPTETDKTENGDAEFIEENKEDIMEVENNIDNLDIYSITNDKINENNEITDEDMQNNKNVLNNEEMDKNNNDNEEDDNKDMQLTTEDLSSKGKENGNESTEEIAEDSNNNTDEDENVLINKNDNNKTKNHKLSNEEEDDDEDVVLPASANKFDVNHNRQKSATNTLNSNGDGEDDGGGEADSHTSSLAIEGFIHGDSEDNTVQSQSAALIDEEPNIRDIISSGDMEQLAQIVLNGDGAKLLNLESSESDIQAFLNNVPNYMSKIRRVHEAARTGSLLALQQALDRRKFAIAKDEISPGGATPLHVAVLFGHTDIVRYLAARFSETNTVTDNDGRTALHYAATIKDNGHFYNLLTQMGANPKLADNLGYTPQFYKDSDKGKGILTYRKLLQNFGAEELEEELLMDQGQIESNQPSSLSNPIFKTEQGKYLASTLADPLIKALTEIAHKRPADPVFFLANFLQNYNKNSNDTKSGSDGTGSTITVNHASATAQAQRNTETKINNSIDDSAIEPANREDDEVLVTPQQDDRDEHGQSMLHFACARSHRRGGLLHLIEESSIDITYRDELYRTARDVSLQANQPANAKEIDRYVLSLAVIGDLRPFQHLALSGYDHILDVTDENGRELLDIITERGHQELTDFLNNLRELEETREELHQMIRELKLDRVHEILEASNAQWLLKAKNYYGRTALHIAILKESEEIVEHLINMNTDILKIGDNLERTALHYAMGTNLIESLSRILIQNGAKRTCKDLKGRQPSYYFMNKADILRLQEEEDETR